MPADQEPPSYEVLAALVMSLRGELADAVAELGRAAERIAELEDRLRKTSRNSSMPPSGEGLAKPPPRSRSLRKKTGRKPGGQDGHPGQTLAQVAKADREERHQPACCVRCGAGLAGRPVTGVERRQVFDLPAVTVKVTEHQLIERRCGCGHRTKGAAPEGADAPVQYGPRIAAVIIYLYTGQFLSKKRTAQALAELFGIPLSPGTVAGITARAAGRLDGFLDSAYRAGGTSSVRRVVRSSLLLRSVQVAWGSAWDRRLRLSSPAGRVCAPPQLGARQTAARSSRLTGALERRGHRVDRDGDVLNVLGATPEEVGEIAGYEQLAVLGLAPRTRSLEEAFIALTGVQS